jgi:hypothetical protein
MEEAPVAGRKHPLTSGATIGREGCDVVLSDPRVSRRHAVMHRLESGPAIEDLGSTNGTYVNDERVRGTHPLAAGDVVRFGSTVWRLQEVPLAPDARQWADTGEPVTAVKGGGVAGPPVARGDVPPPPEVAPSAIRRVLPPPPPGDAPSFQPMPSRRLRGSAATRVEATIVCFAIVAATAIALILYFALYEP